MDLKALAAVVVCPACRSKLKAVGDELICTAADCRRAYAVIDGIPALVVERASILAPGVWYGRTS
ncbi:MAG: Trm112 family protein [Planctomycetota bacterium]